jgi:hypothetical protein
MVIFHSYVSLPEGISPEIFHQNPNISPQKKKPSNILIFYSHEMLIFMAHHGPQMAPPYHDLEQRPCWAMLGESQKSVDVM